MGGKLRQGAGKNRGEGTSPSALGLDSAPQNLLTHTQTLGAHTESKAQALITVLFRDVWALPAGASGTNSSFLTQARREQGVHGVPGAPAHFQTWQSPGEVLGCGRPCPEQQCHPLSRLTDGGDPLCCCEHRQAWLCKKQEWGEVTAG